MADAGIAAFLHRHAVLAQRIGHRVRVARLHDAIAVTLQQQVRWLVAIDEAYGLRVGPGVRAPNTSISFGSVSGRKSYGPAMPMAPAKSRGACPCAAR